MSRALRKAQRQKLEDLSPALHKDASSDSSDEESSVAGSVPNPFDILNAQERDHASDENGSNASALEADEEEDLQNALVESISATNQGQSARRKTKKKKKRLQRPVNTDVGPTSADEDDFDAILNAHHDAVANQVQPNLEEKPFSLTELLTIDVRMLDPNVEMRRLFGSKVVSSERTERATINRRNMPRGLQQQLNRGRKSVLVPVEDNYPLTIKGGLEMTLEEDIDDIKTFRFVHSKAYQQTQFTFLQCVQSGDPQTLMNLLTRAPFHVDTLLQVSEILRHQGDNEQSEEMLTRALFAFDRAFHPRFSIASGLVRLPFEYPENRPFYLAIYRYIQLLGRRGCWATAFEFNKLLYALAPEEDPYAALLSIDFYAIKARNWTYIEKLLRCPWDQVLDNNLPKPNLSYAKAIADVLSSKDNQIHESAKLDMSQAIKTFPYFVGSIFSEIKATSPIQYDGLEPQKDYSRLLRDLYTFRAKDIYNTPEMTKFLRESALVVDDFDPEQMPEEIPINVCRHILLLDERSLLHYLPKEITASPGLSFDPLPPADSMPSYLDTYMPSADALGGQPATMIPTFIQDLLRRILPDHGNNTDIDVAQIAQLMEDMNAEEGGNVQWDEGNEFADPNGYGPNRGVDEPQEEGNAGRR